MAENLQLSQDSGGFGGQTGMSTEISCIINKYLAFPIASRGWASVMAQLRGAWDLLQVFGVTLWLLVIAISNCAAKNEA